MGALVRIRDHHHRAAYLLAEGKRPSEVARELGLSLSRMNDYGRNAEFQALVNDYRNRRDGIELEAFRGVMQVTARIEMLAAEELERRLEEEPDKFSNRELNEIKGDASDRLGRSKVSRTESVSLSVDLADSLAEARRRELKLVDGK